jgi:nucleotide-binding universal stress UspA family protein
VADAYQHVVCCVESGELSAPAVREAARVAGLGAGRLSLVHVVGTAAAFSGGRTSRSRPEDDLQARLVADVEAWLAPLAARAGGTPVIVVDDDAPEAVRRWAVSEGADLIVACPHRSGLARILGSFASGLVRDAPCPVLLAGG